MDLGLPLNLNVRAGRFDVHVALVHVDIDAGGVHLDAFADGRGRRWRGWRTAAAAGEE